MLIKEKEGRSRENAEATVKMRQREKRKGKTKSERGASNFRAFAARFCNSFPLPFISLSDHRRASFELMDFVVLQKVVRGPFLFRLCPPSLLLYLAGLFSVVDVVVVFKVVVLPLPEGLQRSPGGPRRGGSRRGPLCDAAEDADAARGGDESSTGPVATPRERRQRRADRSNRRGSEARKLSFLLLRR